MRLSTTSSVEKILYGSGNETSGDVMNANDVDNVHMETNKLPHYDGSDNPTGCCPRFNPDGWDGRELHFENKRFVKAGTRSVFHIPINMGSVFAKTFTDIQEAGADSDEEAIVLSRDTSSWKGEHYFAVTKDVPGHESVLLSGDYLTRVFEGPYRDVPKWEKAINADAESKGLHVRKNYYFYTTCPKCAKVYGKNYVVAIAEVEPAGVAV